MPLRATPHFPFAALAAYTAFSGAIFISQYYRLSMALLAPELARDLGLTADRLGFLAATYFITFALMQLPVGMVLDRHGPRRTVASLMVLAVTGAIVFAYSSDYPMLLAGQALLGIGTSGGFTGGVVICARWFPQRRFATMSGLLLGIGNVGGLLAATPLALGIQVWGWRAMMLALAAGVLCDALLILIIARDAPPDHPFRTRAAESTAQIFHGLTRVLRSGQVWRLMGLAFVGFACVVTVRGLWGGPYLIDVHKLDPVDAGSVLLAMSVGVIAGAVGYGPLDRLFDSRRNVGLAGGSTMAAMLAVLALWPQPPLWAVAAIFMVLGACGQTYVIVMAHGRAGFDDRLVGRVITTLNTAAFTGTFTLQAATGLILRAFQDSDGVLPEIGYRCVFGFLAIVAALALAIYATAADAKPSEDETRLRIG